jgi:hypothetical protein
MKVSDERGQLVEIHPAEQGGISEIRALGGDAHTAEGVRLGARFADTGVQPGDCRMGESRVAGKLVCYRSAEPEIGYVFEVPGWTGNETPPPERVTGTAVLREFIWTSRAQP